MKAAGILEMLVNDAIEVGRSNWDGYYGSNNDFHITEVHNCDSYKRLKDIIDKHDAEVRL